MGRKFVPAGPPRYRHQQQGLKKLIETKGVAALLFEPGLGKRQPISEPVLTPDGWRPIGDLEVGDHVIGSDGTATEVTGVYDQGTHPGLQLMFQDGATVRCDPEHLWTLHYRAQGRTFTTTMTTAEWLDKPGRERFYLPTVSPVQHPGADLPVDPYLLGALLADGYLPASGQITWRKDEQAVIDEVRAAARRSGLVMEEHTYAGSTARGFVFHGDVRGDLGKRLTSLGVRVPSGEKFIPERYLTASEGQRRALLAGLFDGDGSVRGDRGYARYATSSSRLADGVLQLCWSFGMQANKVRQPHSRGGYWYVNVFRDTSMFRASSHSESVTGGTRNRRRSLLSVEETPPEPMRCIRVAADDHLYVTRDYVVTHNTATTLDYLSLLALKRDDEIRALVVCPLAAVDTWVLQSAEFVHPDVAYWAEALGGSITERAHALAARGGQERSSFHRGKKDDCHRGCLSRRSFAVGAREWPGSRQLREIRERLSMCSDDQRRRDDSSPLAALASRVTLAFGGGGSSQQQKIKKKDVYLAAQDEAQGPRIMLEVLNLDTFASRQRVPKTSKLYSDMVLDAVRDYAPDVVIVDESHKLKGAGSNVSRLMGRVSHIAPRRIILTGTVMPHSPLDVFGQWRFLDPYAFAPSVNGQPPVRPMSYTAFKSKFAIQGGYMGREIVGFHRLDEMQDTMAERAVVATKETALDLPPVTDATLPVRLSGEEQDAYRQMVQDLATRLGDDGELATAPNRLVQMMRLRQITAGYLPSDNGRLHTLGTSKIDTIASLVHDTLASENRLVVFCQFIQEVRDMARALAEPGTTVEVISGGTGPVTRAEIRQRFKDTEGHPERIILVAQADTVSLAINELVTASHAIFASLSQRRDVIVQARDRLHRVGQKGQHVTFWFALAPGTIDDVIHQSYLDRSNLESRLLNHIRNYEEDE